jgi:GT2 family glycosyltransferase
VSDVPFIGGAATFVRKAIFDKLQGFDQGIVQWGYEDIELSIRLWLLGHTVRVVPQSVIYHKFRKKFRYDMNFSDVLYNKLRLVFLHFEGARLRRLWRHHLQYDGAELAMHRLHHDGSEALRDSLKAQRCMSMDDFCDRFGLVS